MKSKLTLGSLVSMIFLFSSCKIIGGIFKAGMWWGIILVVIVVALLIWIFSKLMGK